MALSEWIKITLANRVIVQMINRWMILMYPVLFEQQLLLGLLAMPPS
jgi:hypothetical protein